MVEKRLKEINRAFSLNNDNLLHVLVKARSHILRSALQ